MSRVSLGAGSVMLAIVGLSLSNYTSAQFGGGQPPEKTQPSPSVSAEERIEGILDKPLLTPLLYQDQPLNEIIEALASEYDIPILFDNSALDEVAISPDTEVTISLRNIPFRSALNHILRQPGLEDLTYTVADGVLLITTEEKANETLSVQVYRVDDLIHGISQHPGGTKENPFSSLIQTIVQCVEYGSWMHNKRGEGTILLVQPGMLVVSQTKQVHDQVHALLEKLRATKRKIEQLPTAVAGGS